MNSRNDLSKEGSGLWLSKAPPCPDVGVEIGETGGEEEVGLTVADDHFVYGIDVGVAVDPVVGRQHASADWIVIHDL